MIGIIDRLLLYILGFITIAQNADNTVIVGYSLIGIILLGFSIYFSNKRQNLYEVTGYALVAAISLIIPNLAFFLPLLTYSLFNRYGDILAVTINNSSYKQYGRGDVFDLFQKENYKKLFAIDILMFVITAIRGYVYFSSFKGIMIVCTMLIGAFMGSKYRILKQYSILNKKLRDDGIEQNRILELKNKYLGENQENEVYIATLRERNRIAREIHDNVGHIISRSILQLGAILAINKNTPVEKQLIPVKISLDEAMNSIRESVHDLHKESFDLRQASNELIKELVDIDTHFECDISLDANKNVKYTFLTILKEAITNIIRHSNGRHVTIYMRELEGYYQMVVHDDGTKTSEVNDFTEGIGLKNMEDRVKQLKGIITFQTTNGFRIFISVPKEETSQKGEQ